jgi:seryl-tRNA synthetase
VEGRNVKRKDNMENNIKPTYAVELDYRAMHYVRTTLRKRIDDLGKRIHASKQTSRVDRMREEMSDLIGAVNRLDERLDEHHEKVSASLRTLVGSEAR